MTDTESGSHPLKYGSASLWRAHVALPREIALDERTVFVRAVGRDAVHAAIAGNEREGAQMWLANHEL